MQESNPIVPIIIPPTGNDLDLPVIETGAKSFTWHLGDDEVTITRLKTKPALDTIKVLVGYLDKIYPIIAQVQAGGDIDQTTRLIQALGEVLDADELLSLGARLMGLPIATVGDAPLEDVLAAMCGAIDLNRVPMLIRTVQVLSQKLGLGGN